MALNDYHFVSEWLVEATIEEVSDVLANAEDLVRWWPEVYLKVETTKNGDEHDIGKEVRLLTKGFLPYNLQWKSS